MVIVEHTFTPEDLIAGHPALDLINTVTARNGVPKDWLGDFEAVHAWAGLTGWFSADDLAALGVSSVANPKAAEEALGRLKGLRESLHRTLLALLEVGHPARQAREEVRQLERHWKSAAAAATLTPAPSWSAASSGLDLVRHRVAWEAVDLLQKEDRSRIRVCAGPDCGWLFLDTSKNNRRRWCDMKDCGNAAKARRHLAKLRA